MSGKGKKGKGCLKIFLIALAVIVALFVILMIIAVNSGTDSNTNPSNVNTSENNNSQSENNEIVSENVVFDVTRFIDATPDKVVEIMGEPEDKEDWNYKSGKGDIPLTSYYYDNDNYNFIFYQGKISRLELFCNDKAPYTFNVNDEMSIIKSFGINPQSSYEKYVDTGVTLRFSNVTDNIEDISVYDVDKNAGTYDMIYFTYNDYNKAYSASKTV